MKKYTTILFAILLAINFFIGTPVYAAGAYAGIDNFDSYSNNANMSGLNGGSGWSTAWDINGTGAWKTENTTTFNSSPEAMMHIQGDSGSCLFRELSTAVNSGDFYFAMLETGGAYVYADLAPNSSGGTATYVTLDDDGGPINITVGDLSGRTDLTTSASANTWYVIDWNILSATTFQIRWKAFGGSWSAYSGPFTWTASISSPQYLCFQSGNGTNGYIDVLQNTDPTGTASTPANLGVFMEFF